MELKPDLLRKIYPQAKQSNLIAFCTTFNSLSWLHKMTDILEVAAYLAQVGKETLELTYREEIASGKDYEGRKDLGNTTKGDGIKFKGRAYLQITGRFNYTQFTKWYNAMFKESQDFVNYPERISQDVALCQIASLWFWITKGLKKISLSGDIVAISKKVNGGKNGLAERIAYYNLAIKVLKSIQQVPSEIITPESDKVKKHDT